MAANLAIECADRSVRWYLTPGQTSRYEILVTNQSGDESAECTMSLDDPPAGGAFEPASFTLRPRERKNVTLTFGEETQVPRDQRVLISVRDPDSIVIGSFEHGLISAGSTDCTVSLSFKEPIVDGDDIRGFVISCAIKSLSAIPGTFALQFTPHPALEFVDVTPIKLQPGQTETVAIPILWKRTQKDAHGLDHPYAIEIGVAVSQGRRTFRLLWDTVESKLAALRPAPAPAAPVDELAELLAADTFTPEGDSTAVSQPDSAGAQTHEIAAGSGDVAASSGDAGSPADSGAMDDDALMSLLVGKPVSPPTGWRSPGRDAPDAAEAPPPSIFAKTPPSIMAKPPASAPSPPEAPAPPASAPPASAPPAPAPQPPPTPRPPPAPPRDIVPPVARPQIPAAQPPWVPPREAVPPPAARPQMPVQPTPASAFSSGSAPVAARPHLPSSPSAYSGPVGAAASDPAFEAAIVGPPPTRTRTLQVERELRESARRAEETAKPRAKLEGRLPALVMGGTALIAIALVAFLVLHPYTPVVAPQATLVPTVPPPVVLETIVPTLRPRPGVKPSPQAGASALPSIAPSAASRIAQQATQRVVATSMPASTTRPVVHTPTSTRQAAHTPTPTRQAAHTPAHQTRRYPRPHPTSVVALGGIYARYGASGHAVRVMWGASSQASAQVQLSDDRGGVLSQTDVSGQRQNVLLYVPRSYHGSVYVQVVSIGYQGERTTQSVTLPPFSR